VGKRLTKRIKRVRGGRPSLTRSDSSTLRELENLPVITTTPRPSETPEQKKTRETKEYKNRQTFRKAMQKLFEDLKKNVRNQYVGPPQFMVRKLWLVKWSEIMTEMDSLARTWAVLRGKIDAYYTNEGPMGYTMRALKKQHEQLMQKSKGATKKTKKRPKKTKKKKPKKKKPRRTLLSHVF